MGNEKGSNIRNCDFCRLAYANYRFVRSLHESSRKFNQSDQVGSVVALLSGRPAHTTMLLSLLKIQN